MKKKAKRKRKPGSFNPIDTRMFVFVRSDGFVNLASLSDTRGYAEDHIDWINGGAVRVVRVRITPTRRSAK